VCFDGNCNTHTPSSHPTIHLHPFVDLNALNADTDGDGLSDYFEVCFDGDCSTFTPWVDISPNTVDSDYDGYTDGQEVCHDGNCGVYTAGSDSNPLIRDTDGDKILDGFEISFGTNPVSAADANADYDNDGLTNYQEISYDGSANSYKPYLRPHGTDGTDLNVRFSDTDGDFLKDSFELTVSFTNPINPDSDGDGINDRDEVGYDNDYNNYDPYDPVTNPTGTDLNANSADTDGDGLLDNIEAGTGFDPLLVDFDIAGDTDGDGITDLDELSFDGDSNSYDPFHPIDNISGRDLDYNNPDTDGDGVSDGDEVNFDGDPAYSYYHAVYRPSGTDINPFKTDTDNDGISDFDEINFDGDEIYSYYHPVTSQDGTDLNPINPDTDFDGLSDFDELNLDGDASSYYPYHSVTNPTGKDSDPVNPDTDGDEYSDYEEVTLYGGTVANYNPYEPVVNTTGTDIHVGRLDTDGDLLNDFYEVNTSNTSPVAPDINLDSDGDLLSDYYEINFSNTSPIIPDINLDSDGDSILDYDEINFDGNPGYNPYHALNNPDGTDLDTLSSDTDGDGLSDSIESTFGTNPLNPDSDNDGLSDYFEANFDGNPDTYSPYPYGADLDANSADTDADGLSDFVEVNFDGDPSYNPLTDINPLVSDTDGDGVSDGFEVSQGSGNPLINDLMRVITRLDPPASTNLIGATDVNIYGIAGGSGFSNDLIFESWNLDYGIGGTPTVWNPLASSNVATLSGPPEISQVPITAGHEVAIDGEWMAVSNTAGDMVKIFKHDGHRWNRVSEVMDPHDGIADSGTFGRSLAISGNTLVVGAARAAYVYKYNGLSWSYEATLEPSDLQKEIERLAFGVNVAVDSNTIVVAARTDRNQALYIYSYDTVDGWLENQKLEIGKLDRNGLDYYFDVEIQGSTLVIAAPHNKENVDSLKVTVLGEVYIYANLGGGGGPGSWDQISDIRPKIFVMPGDVYWETGGGHTFASALALEGNTLAVNASKFDDITGSQQGVVYLYNLDDINNPVVTEELLAPDPASEFFGASLDIDQETLVIMSMNLTIDGAVAEIHVYSTAGNNGLWLNEGEVNLLEGGGGGIWVNEPPTVYLHNDSFFANISESIYEGAIASIGEELLTNWDISMLADGQYTLRLTVTD
ncbi:MAG: hypothetical protein KAS32_30510, partial [Candidatus Peribacteraceae bacterium]|nr:hypothetical protein [Candidatus Peribacteraceae bacterium]